MTKKENIKRKKDPYSGLALAFTFLIIALILFFIPDYFKYILASRIIMYGFTFIGIIGLSIEIDRDKKSGTSDLGLGVSFALIWAIFYYYFPIWWVNIITFFILFFSIFGISRGLIRIFITVRKNKISIRNNLGIKLIGQIFGIVLVIFQILEILNVF